MAKSSKESRKGVNTLAALFPFVKRHTVALSFGFAIMLVQNYGAMRIPGYFQKIVDEIGGANRASVIGSLLLGAAIFAAITVVSMYLMRRLIIGASRLVEYDLRERIYDRLLELEYSFYQSHETGPRVAHDERP